MIHDLLDKNATGEEKEQRKENEGNHCSLVTTETLCLALNLSLFLSIELRILYCA